MVKILGPHPSPPQLGLGGVELGSTLLDLVLKVLEPALEDQDLSFLGDYLTLQLGFFDLHLSLMILAPPHLHSVLFKKFVVILHTGREL